MKVLAGWMNVTKVPSYLRDIVFPKFQPTRTIPLDPYVEWMRASHARSLGGGGRPNAPSARSAPPRRAVEFVMKSFSSPRRFVAQPSRVCSTHADRARAIPRRP